MGTEEFILQSMYGLSPWMPYKRYSDGKQVSARLVGMGTKKMMQVREKMMGDFCCPKCGELLSQHDTGEFPDTYLEPPIFHDRHKPIA
jgi:hypothetical protein